MIRTHYVEDASGGKATVAGWVHEIRDLGKLAFVILRDRTGLIQVTVKKNECPPEIVKTVEGLVKETAIAVTGTIRKSEIAGLGKELFPEKIEVIGEVR